VTSSFALRVLELDPEHRRVRLRVTVLTYDKRDRYHDPLPDDPSFFMRVLWDEADTRFGDGGPLGDAVSVDEILDDDWVDSNTWRYVARVREVTTRNVPFTEAHWARLPGVWSYSDDGEFLGAEEVFVGGDYDVWVTDGRWVAHLYPGMSWCTASYATDADQLGAADAPFLPVPHPPVATFDVFDEQGSGRCALAFSDGGQYLAVTREHGTVVVYRVGDWIEVLRIDSGVTMSRLSWVPGCSIVTLDDDAATASWAYDLASGAVVEPGAARAAAGPGVLRSWVPSLAPAPDGRYLAFSCGTEIGVLRMSDAALTMRCHLGGPSVLAWSPDGRWLAAADCWHPAGKTHCYSVGRPVSVDRTDPTG
jgi:hypothetical protein